MREIWSITEGLETYTKESEANTRIRQLTVKGKKFTVNYVDC